jgi:hypothetical protein
MMKIRDEINFETFVLASFYFYFFIDIHLRDFLSWFALLSFFPITLQSYFRVCSKDYIGQLLGVFLYMELYMLPRPLLTFLSHYHLWEVL